MVRSYIVVALSASLLVACTTEQDDLRSWMTQQESGMRGRVDPLPEIKPFPVVEYGAELEESPFSLNRIEPESRGTQVTGGPDLTRQREPLEVYPLESLSMVGVLMQEDKIEALISVSGTLHQVRVGNYMGQNHGVITGINETEVSLLELIEDMNGDWVEQPRTLQLQEQ
ncbi:MAG: pilus assembly protein PilP [Rhodocyclaceae bacterium]|jgi:type IV pilus assembly protein PilP|nr:pilus assembly protein PilP [Rhodocyclaceae bacterium]